MSSKFFDLTLEWELVTDCNYSCNYCFFDVQNTKKYDLYSRSYKLILNKIKKLSNNIRIILLGGEPTLHPNFKNIVEELISFDNIVEIEIITNGSSNLEKLKELLKYDKIVLNISLHFKYYKESFINKIVELNKFRGLTVAVMVPPEETYYDIVLKTINQLLSYNVNIELIEILQYKVYSDIMLKILENFSNLRDDEQNKFIINKTKQQCKIRYYTINPFGIIFCRCVPEFKKPFTIFNEKDFLNITCFRNRCPSGNCEASIKESLHE